MSYYLYIMYMCVCVYSITVYVYSITVYMCSIIEYMCYYISRVLLFHTLISIHRHDAVALQQITAVTTNVETH